MISSELLKSYLYKCAVGTCYGDNYLLQLSARTLSRANIENLKPGICHARYADAHIAWLGGISERGTRIIAVYQDRV